MIGRTIHLRPRAGLALGTLAFAIGVSTATAAPVDQATAERIAIRYMAARQAEYRSHLSRKTPTSKRRGSIDIDVSRPKTVVFRLSETGETLGYVTVFDPVGYVVTSAESNVGGVIAFSLESRFSFDDTDQNPFLHLIRADLSQRVATAGGDTKDRAAPTTKQGSSPTAKAVLAQFGNDEAAASGGEPNIWGPLLDTQWRQTAPYNAYCPIDPVTGDRCLAGSAATASAQIMNYWQWPHSIDFAGGPPGTPEAYDSYVSTFTPWWEDPPTPRTIPMDADTADIPNVVYAGNPLDPNLPTDETIGRLMYACGVATHMLYSSVGSGGTCGLGRFGYTTSSISSLAANLKAGRPAWCALWSVIPPEQGGRGMAIVCDGLWEPNDPATEPLMYHLNFGSNETADGWYDLAPCTEGGLPYPWGGLSGTSYVPPPPAIVAIADANVAEGIPCTGPAPDIVPELRSRPCAWSLPDPNNTAAGMTVDPSTGVIQWNSPGPLGSRHVVTLCAKNEAGEDMTTFRVTVVPPLILDPNHIVWRVPDGPWQQCGDGAAMAASLGATVLCVLGIRGRRIRR